MGMGRGGVRTAPDGEPVAGNCSFVVGDTLETFLADIEGDCVGVDFSQETEEIGPVEDVGEVDAHAYAEGEDGGYEGYAEGGALFGGESGWEADGVVVEGDYVLLVCSFPEIPVVC